MTPHYSILYKIFSLLSLVLLVSCQGRRSILKEIVRDIDVPLGGTVIYGLITYLYEDGKLVHQLESSRFVNFTETGNMEFTDLNYKEIDGENINTMCRSGYATYTEADKLAYLNNAILEDNDLNVEAKRLRVDFSSEFIYGEHGKIISDQQRIEGDSFKYDLLEKHIEINSNVRGSYNKEEEAIEEDLFDEDLSD